MAVAWKKLAYEEDVILESFMAAKGDLISASADDTPLILSKGTDGYVLKALASEATGLVWAVEAGAGAIDITPTPIADDVAVWTDGDSLAGQSVAEFWAHISAGATAAVSLNEQNLTNVGTIGCDTLTVVDGYGISLQEALTFTGATTENLITFTDNTAIALQVQGADAFAYMQFISTTDAEAIAFGVDGAATGIDVTFCSDTTGDNMVWTGSGGCVLTMTGTDGAAVLNIADGDAVITDKLYFFDDDGGEYLSSDGSTLTITGAVSHAGEVTLADTYSLNLQEAITFTGATTENIIEFPDALADALSFEEGGTAYLTFVTTNASEAVLLGKNLDVSNLELLNAGLHTVADDAAKTALTGLVVGQVCWQTDDACVYVCTVNA